jgi:hypothetical protein
MTTKLLPRIRLSFILILVSSSLAHAHLVHVHFVRAMPAGNYSQSCHFCSIQGNVLSCECQDGKGFTNSTALEMPETCAYVENIDGNLQCSHWNQSVAYPYPYTTTKVDIDAGPIWNQTHAQRRCPRVCASQNGRWTGNWTTVETGNTSVCQCDVWQY